MEGARDRVNFNIPNLREGLNEDLHAAEEAKCWARHLLLPRYTYEENENVMRRSEQQHFSPFRATRYTRAHNKKSGQHKTHKLLHKGAPQFFAAGVKKKKRVDDTRP